MRVRRGSRGSGVHACNTRNAAPSGVHARSAIKSGRGSPSKIHAARIASTTPWSSWGRTRAENKSCVSTAAVNSRT